ncbi:hypothetical protein SK128_018084 [Halocaridina rubra]|uniref:Uncharacterized protein n=1 Tax=Halocaridina rubra TaxID=373956 RepID=A0AAN8X5R0_HALRR
MHALSFAVMDTNLKSSLTPPLLVAASAKRVSSIVESERVSQAIVSPVLSYCWHSVNSSAQNGNAELSAEQSSSCLGSLLDAVFPDRSIRCACPVKLPKDNLKFCDRIMSYVLSSMHCADIYEVCQNDMLLSLR